MNGTIPRASKSRRGARERAVRFTSLTEMRLLPFLTEMRRLRPADISSSQPSIEIEMAILRWYTHFYFYKPRKEPRTTTYFDYYRKREKGGQAVCGSRLDRQLFFLVQVRIEPIQIAILHQEKQIHGMGYTHS